MDEATRTTPSVFSGNLDPDDLRRLAERLRTMGENPMRLLSESDLANHLGITINGVRKWRSDGGGPAWTRLGRAVRYRLIDVEAWLVHREREPYESNLQKGRRNRATDAVLRASGVR